MNYTHIFTDGMDKLLSASTWFMWYGGKDAFCYYENNALKGYVENEEYSRLARVGHDLLKDGEFIHELFHEADKLSKELKIIQSKLKKKNSRNLDTLAHLSLLLKKLYRNFFFTEEFYTDKLDPDKDAELIEIIGKFRYEASKVCIQATEDVHDLAKYIVGKNPEFYLIEEILHENEPADLNQRKTAFLLTQNDHRMKLFSGKEAVKMFKTMSQKSEPYSRTKLAGMGASKGRVTGSVYKVSLASENLHDQIMKMPDGAILVTESTQPQLILACKKASAIIADEGGILSHAAIIARELGIPCVVGTRRGTQILNNFDNVFVDGKSGKVLLLTK